MSDQSIDHKPHDQTQIREFINRLGSDDDATRWEARQSLVTLKHTAVPELLQALQDRNPRRRREAAKALGQIADPTSVTALINALADDENDVRWAAADSLEILRHATVRPLLQALIHHSESMALRTTARHILRILGIRLGLETVFSPVIQALDGIEPTLAVPIAAQQALDALATK